MEHPQEKKVIEGETAPGPYSVDQVMEGFEPELITRLAVLDQAPPDTVDVALSMFPLGWRLAMGSYGVITESEQHPDGDYPSAELTDFGRAVLRESAARAVAQETNLEHEALKARAEKLRDSVAHVRTVETVRTVDG